MQVKEIERILSDWYGSRQVYVRIVGGPDAGAVYPIHSIKEGEDNRLCIIVRAV